MNPLLFTFMLLILAGMATAAQIYWMRTHHLERAIRKLCSQRLDDLCWQDLYELAEAGRCPMPDLKLLPREIMLRNCEKYVDCLGKCPADRAEALRQYKEWKRQHRYV